MRRICQPLALLFLIVTLSLYSCEKDKACENCPGTNKPPVAFAGPDQTITLPTSSASIDGGASTDSENNITSFRWVKISGPASFTIANANAVQTQVTDLVEGSYAFELMVTDAGGLFSKDTLHITVLSSLFDGREIYIAGRGTESGAALWHNGAIQVLTGEAETTALSVFVSGNDVYAAGGANNHWLGFDTTFVWKNGVAQNLERQELAGATSVFVRGNDVYAAGWGDMGAVLWKNGQAASLGNEGANAVFVSGSDVYVAGWERRDIGQTQTLVAKYWKNGAALTLNTGGSGISVANCMFVFNSHVYIAGYIGHEATLWKNGVAQTLGEGVAQTVYVTDDDVYVAGSSNGNATLWKNGVRQILGKGEARAMHVLNGDVYVAGHDDTKAMLWKNGIAHSLPGLREANSVFVK